VQVADKTARAVVDIVGVGPQSPPLETPDDPSGDKFARPLSYSPPPRTGIDVDVDV